MDNDFSGTTYKPARDKRRLNIQLLRVAKLMSDGQPRTLSEIGRKTGSPEASVSARLRDLRNKFGATVNKSHQGGGVWEYVVIESASMRSAIAQAEAQAELVLAEYA